MAIFFLILICLSVLHFILEGIIVPSIRLSIRFKLFTLRDEVRAMRIRHGKNLDDEMYHFLENSISRTIKHLANLTLTGAIEAHRFVEANDSIRNEVERAIRRIETSPQEIRETVRKHQQLFGVAILANASGWFIYIIPIIIVALFVMFFLNKCATAIKTLMFLPEDEMDKFLPPESLSTI